MPVLQGHTFSDIRKISHTVADPAHWGTVRRLGWQAGVNAVANGITEEREACTGSPGVHTHGTKFPVSF